VEARLRTLRPRLMLSLNLRHAHRNGAPAMLRKAGRATTCRDVRRPITRSGRAGTPLRFRSRATQALALRIMVLPTRYDLTRRLPGICRSG
jgi:hypothetical protein